MALAARKGTESRLAPKPCASPGSGLSSSRDTACPGQRSTHPGTRSLRPSQPLLHRAQVTFQGILIALLHSGNLSPFLFELGRFGKSFRRNPRLDPRTAPTRSAHAHLLV